jgi:UDP-3-O-[3-hydroxymyristoyl] N-acetylglucosamine deacetylase/3-hydroxyacyl-[acyl-carrier-protein] dehydratase
LENQPVISAVAENVKGTQRGTVLSKNEVQVSTVEHAMAALYAYEVDNCLIEVNAPEFPILDGSSIVYANEIERVGLEEQDEKRDFYIVKSKIEIKDEETGSSITVLPDDSFGVHAHITFDSIFLDNQFAILDNLKDFKKEIAASRTFVFVREIEPLLQNGLIKGGDLDNAIVIYERQISQERLDKLADTMGVGHKDATEMGYIMNKPLSFSNEPARHKLLDILGDIALIGKPIIGKILASCPGHKINNQFARLIRKDIRQNEIQAPVYNVNIPPVMDINRIKELLPHRYPFLLVDKIIEVGQKHIVGVKNISVNEPFFQGHFPEEPVMPGVLQVEAMAQAAGILVLSGIDDPHRYSTYFLKIDNVKFRQKVVPGDTVILRVEFMIEPRRGVACLKGYCFVGEKIVCEAELMAQIVKNK